MKRREKQIDFLGKNIYSKREGIIEKEKSHSFF